MSKALSWVTYKSKDHTKEEGVGYGKSVTVPDQALSLKQLLYNYTRGIPINERHGEYLGDSYVPDFNTMDLADIADYKANLSEEIADLEARVKQAEKEAFEKKKAEYKQKPSPEVQNPEDQEVSEKLT